MGNFISCLMSCGKKVLNIVIQGDPVVQERPRFTKTGHAYENKRCTKAKADIREITEFEMKNQNFPKAHKDMQIILECVFYKEIPKSKSPWWKLAARFGLIAPITRTGGDIDNLIKLALDGVNGVCMYDDSQVCEIHAYSRYSDKPRTEITITALYTNIGDIKSKVKILKELA